MKINTIIFDFGGVITDSPLKEFRKLEKINYIESGSISKVVMNNPDTNSWAKCERGEIDIKEFSFLFEKEAELLGYNIDISMVLKKLYGPIRPMMVKKIKLLIQNNYKVVCLTNVLKGMKSITPINRTKEVEKILKYFHKVYESCELGMRKPEKRIYKYLVDDLNVFPENCVFLDDLGDNLKTAKNLGIKTIKVVNPNEALSELDSILKF